MTKFKLGKIKLKKKWIRVKFQNFLNKIRKKNKNMKKPCRGKRKCQRKSKGMWRNSI